MRHLRVSQEQSYSCRCSTTFPVDQKTMNNNAWRMPISFLCMQRDLEKDNGHLLVQVPRRSGILWMRNSPQGIWWNSQRVDVQFFRASSPLSRGRLRSKGHGQLLTHFAADLETIETSFRIIVSANQLSLYGAIAEICEEYENLHERTERPVVMGQTSSSLVLSVIKTEVPLDCDDPANKDLLMQQYGERTEKLSQQDELSKNLYGRRIF